MYHTEPVITVSLTIDEARALFEDLEDVRDSFSGPGLSTPSIRLMGELGATLEDGGYLPDEDPDDDPDPGTPADTGKVIPVDFGKKDHDPSVETWQDVIRKQINDEFNKNRTYPYIWNKPYVARF